MRERLARPPLELEPGPQRLHGTAKKRRRSEDDVLCSGSNVSVIVAEKRARYWKRSESIQEARSFNLVTDQGDKIRVRLRGNEWSLETDARQRNGPERRSVEYQLADGERVWVEGELRAVNSKTTTAGYRDGAPTTRWEVVANEEPIKLWTEGALYAHKATEFLPPFMAVPVWAFSSLMLWWSYSLILGGRASTLEAIYFVSNVVLFSIALALVIVHWQGGWIGSRAWFDRKE